MKQQPALLQLPLLAMWRGALYLQTTSLPFPLVSGLNVFLMPHGSCVKVVTILVAIYWPLEETCQQDSDRQIQGLQSRHLAEA